MENPRPGNSVFFQSSFLTNAIRSVNCSARAVTATQRASRTASFGIRAEPAPTAKAPAAKHSPRFFKLPPLVELPDDLIDRILYRLYGLTEEEIAISKAE